MFEKNLVTLISVFYLNRLANNKNIIAHVLTLKQNKLWKKCYIKTYDTIWLYTNLQISAAKYIFFFIFHFITLVIPKIQIRRSDLVFQFQLKLFIAKKRLRLFKNVWIYYAITSKQPPSSNNVYSCLWLNYKIAIGFWTGVFPTNKKNV